MEDWRLNEEIISNIDIVCNTKGLPTSYLPLVFIYLQRKRRYLDEWRKALDFVVHVKLNVERSLPSKTIIGIQKLEYHDDKI